MYTIHRTYNAHMQWTHTADIWITPESQRQKLAIPQTRTHRHIHLHRRHTKTQRHTETHTHGTDIHKRRFESANGSIVKDKYVNIKPHHTCPPTDTPHETHYHTVPKNMYAVCVLILYPTVLPFAGGAGCWDVIMFCRTVWEQHNWELYCNSTFWQTFKLSYWTSRET